MCICEGCDPLLCVSAHPHLNIGAGLFGMRREGGADYRLPVPLPGGSRRLQGAEDPGVARVVDPLRLLAGVLLPGVPPGHQLCCIITLSIVMVPCCLSCSPSSNAEIQVHE